MFVAGKVMDVSRWEDISKTSASFANARIRVRGYIGTLSTLPEAMCQSVPLLSAALRLGN